MRILRINKSVLTKFTSAITIVAVVLVTSYAPQWAKPADAASLTALKATLSPATGAYNAEKASTVANYTIQFTTPTGVASGQTIILDFDNSTTSDVALDYTDIDLTDDGVDVTLAAAPSGATWGVVRTDTDTITFTNGTTAVAASSVIVIEIGTHATNGTTGDKQITNGSAGTTLISISGTFTDTGTIGVPIIADDVVVVNAKVTPSISFSISDNSIFFGNLRASGNSCWAQGTDPGAVACPTVAETEAFNMTAGTNATSGYIITAQGATLTSGANTITALGSNTAPSIGTEQFGIRANASGGSGAVQAPFTASGYAWTPTASTAVTVASATAPSATTTYSVRYMANIAAVTEAGTYTANHTYVATATY